MELKRKSISRDSTKEAEGAKEPSGKGKPAAQDGPVLVENKNSRRPSQKMNKAGGDLNQAREQAEGEDASPGTEVASAGKKKLLRKVFFYGIPSLCLLMLAAGLLSFKFGWHAGLFGAKPRLEPITSIKRPIPVPDYREMLDFLLLYDVGGQKMITALRMEFGYQSPSRYQNFKEQNVLMRDTVYSFLLKQNLSRHTVKSWHSVIERDLLEYLRVQLPHSQADSIRLTQVENL
ncbi:MAG: hypothetical protein AB9866_05975 [Syntrophobacteraceae bacterium]